MLFEAVGRPPSTLHRCAYRKLEATVAIDGTIDSIDVELEESGATWWIRKKFRNEDALTAILITRDRTFAGRVKVSSHVTAMAETNLVVTWFRMRKV